MPFPPRLVQPRIAVWLRTLLILILLGIFILSSRWGYSGTCKNSAIDIQFRACHVCRLIRCEHHGYSRYLFGHSEPAHWAMTNKFTHVSFSL